MRRGPRSVFFVVFAVTGFSALTLQVVWQRVISLHAGVDLVSFTTVVSAFLAGIGLGSLVGGVLADRLGPRRSVVAFALSNVGIGLFAWGSIWLFYDGYEQQAASLTTTASKFAFNMALLLVPTTLMGLSLPLVAKGVVERVGDAGPLVGRLYAVNTLGAAIGAAVAGWYLIGSYGFVATVRVAGTLNLLAAVLVVVAARSLPAPGEDAPLAHAPAGGQPAGPESVAAADRSDEGDRGDGAVDAVARLGVWPWYVVYGLTGAVALGFELVFFRMIDTIMRSNSYSFAHVLSVYLLLFAAGSALASPVVRRVRRPEQWFLWLQFLVGVTALGGIVFVTKVLPRTSLGPALHEYFAGEGYAVGFRNPDGSLRSDLLTVFVGAPLVVLGLPVLCMGASFPFVQSLVNRRMDTLGRRTGLLLFSNVVGNVVGTLVVGFVVIDRLGTSGTYRLLALLLLVPALVAAWLARGAARRVGLALGSVLVLVLLLRLFPPNTYLWAFLHSATDAAAFHAAEDRSCANALTPLPGGLEDMTVNGASQNPYPFDDFHLLIGLTPALVHPDPQRAMALGLGIGATPYGLSLDERIDRVDVVEICGPQVPLLADLGERRAPELRRFLSDPKVHTTIGDGRDFLLRADGDFDVVVVDTLRQHSAFSGNLYSEEFYGLVADRLGEHGVLAQWAPTQRTLNTVLEVFPYVTIFNVPSWQNSAFFLASRSPITYDRAAVLDRLAQVSPDAGLSAEQATSIRTFFEQAVPTCVVTPEWIRPARPEQLNSDLFPRDEYFLNNDPAADGRAECAPPP